MVPRITARARATAWCSFSRTTAWYRTLLRSARNPLESRREQRGRSPTELLPFLFLVFASRLYGVLLARARRVARIVLLIRRHRQIHVRAVHPSLGERSGRVHGLRPPAVLPH